MDNTEVPPFSSPPPPYSPPPPPPPPLTPPPIIVPPASGPQPKRGRGWMVFALIVLVLFVISAVMNLGQFVSGISPMKAGRGVRYVGPRLEEAIMEDHDSSDKIAVIDIDGIITSREVDQSGYTMVDLVKAQLEKAKDDSRVRAVLLRMDSPGGEVLASDEIFRAMVSFQKDSGKPVVTSMGNLAASGGYYISAASRWIVANEMTITGSIGVIMHTWNYRGLMDKIGLTPEVFKSGKYKDMLSGERTPAEIPPEERKMVQSLIDETYARFKTVVEQGRDSAHKENQEQGKALARDWQDYADGRVLSGTQARDLGFVDSVGNFEDAVKRAEEIAGIDSANLVKYQQRYDFLDFFRVFGKSEAPVLKVDVGMEAPKLEAGRLYFLSPTFLH